MQIKKELRNNYNSCYAKYTLIFYKYFFRKFIGFTSICRNICLKILMIKAIAKQLCIELF